MDKLNCGWFDNLENFYGITGQAFRRRQASTVNGITERTM